MRAKRHLPSAQVRLHRETKANLIYVTQEGVNGEFDIIWQQNFNGPRPRWRLTLIWDWGETVYFEPFYAECRLHIEHNEDLRCGRAEFLPAHISASRRREDWPSPPRYVSIPLKLFGDEQVRFHDDLIMGAFVAGTIMYTPVTDDLRQRRAHVLHTGRWHDCGSDQCRYYQVPWTSTP